MIPRPPSRSERLLRDTLRKDDTLRTHAAHRPRSSSSVCDDDDDDFFQSAILYRCSRRNSAASHTQPPGFYIPDQTEHASYSTLLRSSSHSGSSRSGHSDRKHSPRSTRAQEKHEDPSRHHDAAPHEAVLRSRLDSVMHSMRIDNDADLESSTLSLPSSVGSTSSHHAHCTIPEPESWTERGHRHTLPTPTTHAHISSPRRASTQPRVPSESPRSPRSPRALRSTPRTPSQEKERPKHSCADSPWLYAPLPPSPPAFSTPPSKRGGPAVMTFVASPTAIESHMAHLPTACPVEHPHSSANFDPEAAALALKELQGYVSFSSVAGLGAPPEEEDRRSIRKPFALGGKGRLSGLGLGSGKWWIF